MDSNFLYDTFIADKCRVVTDSRVVTKGDIYFALKGSLFDGNRFATEALRKGARLVVVDDRSLVGENIICVDDSLVELQNIAARYRRSLNIPVLAITGSNGKTTTKELISAILSKRFKVHSTCGNLNNHIGVPLTLLSAPADSEFIIVEMGANHVGEIYRLCEISDPTFGIITNIGRAHLDGFGSVEGIVEAKSELFKYLFKKGGLALYNSENKLLKNLINSIGLDSIPYSRPGITEIRIIETSNDPTLTLKIRVGAESHSIKTNLFGQQNVENIIAAVASGVYFDIQVPDIVKTLADYKPDNNRSQLITTPDNVVICDAYNANPTSMLAAIESFLVTAKSPKTLILGDMLELGEYAEKEHLGIIEKLAEVPDLNVLLVGPIFYEISQNSGFVSFKDVYELSDYLSVSPIKDNFVLVKGSRGIRLETIYPQL